MVSFDFSVISLLTKETVEDEGALWNYGSISWLSVNRISYHGRRVQVVNGHFFPCVGVSLVAAYCRAGSRSASSVWLPFCVFLSNKTHTPPKRTAI